jgi:hypothetical protein
MGNFGHVLQIAVTIVAVIAGGVATTLLTVVRTLRQSNDDLRKRVDDLEDDRDDLRAKLTERDQNLNQTRRDMDALRKVVTGEAHWVALRQQPRRTSRAVDADLGGDREASPMLVRGKPKGD